MTTATAKATDDLLVFMRNHWKTLHSVCLRWTRGNEADAADLLSAAAVRVLESRSAKRLVIEQPLRWWCRVIGNLARDQHRTRAAAAHAMDELALELAATSAADDAFAVRERYQRLCAVIGVLPAKQQEALLLRTSGLEYEEVAERLRTSNANARKLVELARSKALEALSSDSHQIGVEGTQPAVEAAQANGAGDSGGRDAACILPECPSAPSGNR